MNYNQLQIKQLIDSGPEIAFELGLAKKYLYSVLKENHIEINRIPKTNNDYGLVMSLHNDGKTIAEIADQVNIHKRTIYAYFYRRKIKPNEDNGILTGYSMFPMNEHKAYLLGIIYGDGSLNKSKKEIMISMNDFDVLDSINKNVFDNKIRITNRNLPSGKSHYSLGIYNSCIYEELVEHFQLCNNKSAVLKWPKLDESLLPHFVRGLVDSDGSFFNDKSTGTNLVFAYGSCSGEFVENLKRILMHYCNVNDVKISIVITSGKNPFYIIKWNNKKDAISIGNWIYKNAICKCGRKFEIWDKVNKQQA